MLRHLWAVAGAALLGVGLVLVLTSDGPADYGWFAYTPLDDDAGSFPLAGNAVILSRTELIGSAVGVLGLVVLALGIGYRLGQRRAGQPTESS